MILLPDCSITFIFLEGGIHVNDSIPRIGCVDVWNSYMVKDASFVLGTDIPVCPTTAKLLPKELVSYTKAKSIHKKMVASDPDYHIDSYVHFYIDDQKFDGKRSSIWLYPEKSYEILRHFAGVITPDFSTCLDFPDPIKRFNTYRMRAFGFWLGTKGISVINNVRWGTEDTWEYCFDGIPLNGIVAIGTVASGLKYLENRELFENGLLHMIEVLKPHTIICYGSANYSVFKDLIASGITVISFPSETSIAFKGVKGDE